MIRFIAFNLFIFFFAVYLLTATGVNFYNADASQLRNEVVKSIIERSHLSVPEGIGIRGADGREYSWLGIGSALLAIPFYVAGKITSVATENIVSIMNQLIGAATVVLIFLFSIFLGYSRKASLLVAFFYGLGTIAWPLAKQFDHTIETFFILLSVYFMYRYLVHNKVTQIFFSSIFLGIAFITRYTSILVLLPLFIMVIIYYFRKSDFNGIVRLIVRDVVLFSIGFLPFICLILWYNYFRFNSIFETGYSLMAARYGIDFFTGSPLLTGLIGFLISPGKGFFYYSPVAVFFFFCIGSFFKRHLELAICFILIILSYLFFLSKNLFWHGDWAWGPRYILAITPFLIMPIAELFESGIWLKKSFKRMAVCFIFALSLVIQITAVSVDFQKYFLNLQLEEKVKFTVVSGDGVQPIIEPPIETYFNWHRSPILAQFRFIYEIAVNMKDYRYSEPPKGALFVEKIKADPRMNVFDFWWVYKYFLDGSYSGFIVAFLLIFVSIYSFSRLLKAVT